MLYCVMIFWSIVISQYIDMYHTSLVCSWAVISQYNSLFKVMLDVIILNKCQSTCIIKQVPKQSQLATYAHAYLAIQSILKKQIN